MIKQKTRAAKSIHFVLNRYILYPNILWAAVYRFELFCNWLVFIEWNWLKTGGWHAVLIALYSRIFDKMLLTLLTI